MPVLNCIIIELKESGIKQVGEKRFSLLDFVTLCVLVLYLHPCVSWVLVEIRMHQSPIEQVFQMAVSLCVDGGN